MSDKVYCICRKADDGKIMICCDNCEEWFHGKCVGLLKRKIKSMKNYICKECQAKANPKSQRPPAPLPKIETSQYQCQNPDCKCAARLTSKFCTDDCGRRLAQIRLERFFEPAARLYVEGGIALLDWREEEGARLITEREQLISTASELEKAIVKLENDIQIIRHEAQSKMECDRDEDGSMQSDAENEAENETETASSEATRTSCVSCGSLVTISTLLKHWASCFKRNESMFTYSNNFEHVDAPFRPFFKAKIFCDREVKTKNRPLQYCKRLYYICPEHNNADDFKFDGDEVCACPLTIGQELVKDGNYCAELKRDCTQHYQWERFRRAHIDIERLQVYYRLVDVTAKISTITENISKQGAGPLGIILHKAIPATKQDEFGY